MDVLIRSESYDRDLEERMDQQAEAARAMWSTGDYAAVGETVVEEVGVAGLDVVDVATGTGNTALAAARAGGRVTGIDVTPELLAVARRRAEAAGLAVAWVEGDMMSMGFPDRGFDRVLSTFGAFTAPDPRAMAAELVRVCRPGGVVATTAWTPEGMFGRLGATLIPFFPEPPDRPVDPMDWARPERVRSSSQIFR